MMFGMWCIMIMMYVVYDVQYVVYDDNDVCVLYGVKYVRLLSGVV